MAGADYVVFNDSLTTSTLDRHGGRVLHGGGRCAGCVFRDTVEVEFRPVPVFDLSADSVLCPGDVLAH